MPCNLRLNSAFLFNFYSCQFNIVVSVHYYDIAHEVTFKQNSSLDRIHEQLLSTLKVPVSKKKIRCSFFFFFFLKRLYSINDLLKSIPHILVLYAAITFFNVDILVV